MQIKTYRAITGINFKFTLTGLLIIILSSCGPKLSRIQPDTFKKYHKRLLSQKYRLSFDGKPITPDTISFYLRNISPKIIKTVATNTDVELGQKPLISINSIVYEAILNKDIAYFRNNYPEAIWAINRRPYIDKGELMEEELKRDLALIRKSEIVGFEFIFPDMAVELFGNRLSVGMVILTTK